MKLLSLFLVFGMTALVLSSCTPARRAGLGYGPRPYAIYPSSIYEDEPGGWDVYRARGGGTRVKYDE